MTLLLGLDIGTTSLKAVLLDHESGRIVHSASRPTPVHHPRPGWSEHGPQELWQAVTGCVREVAASARQPVSALAISSMAEAGVLVDRAGQSLAPIIAWYDRRSEAQAAWIEEVVDIPRLYGVTGQRASPSFGVTKLLWMRENQPAVFASGAHWLPVPSYLLYRFTGQMAVDYTIASRTLVFDQASLDWSTALLDAFQLPRALFPPAMVSGTPIGKLSASAASETGLSTGTLCVLGGHDHLCASFAAGAVTTGAVIDSTGSANALVMLVPRFQADAELGQRGYACYHFVLPQTYALKGGLKAAGSAVEWLARQLSAGSPEYQRLEASAAEGAGKRAGPLWLPHLIGSGTPEGDRFSRAAMIGARYEHTAGDLFRGMLESLACWLRHNLEEMQARSGLEAQTLTLIGGATRLALLSQMKADLIGSPVRVPQIPEAAATGAALLAGLGAAIFDDPASAVRSLRYESTTLNPRPETAAWYDRLYREVYLPLYRSLQPLNEVMEQLDRSG